MKFFSATMILLFGFSLMACNSHQLKPGQLKVSISEEIESNEKRIEEIEYYRVDAYLKQYLREFARKAKIREGVVIRSTISKSYFGDGRDFLGANTIVMEDGVEVKNFYLEVTSKRKNSGKRLAALLARDIMLEAKKVLKKAEVSESTSVAERDE